MPNVAPLERIEALIAEWDGKQVFVEIPLSVNGAFMTIAGKLEVEAYTDTNDPYFDVWGMGHGVRFHGSEVRQVEPTTYGPDKKNTLIVRLKKNLT